VCFCVCMCVWKVKKNKAEIQALSAFGFQYYGRLLAAQAREGGLDLGSSCFLPLSLLGVCVCV